MNYIDIIVLIIIGLTIFEGLRKGLIKMIFELVGLIIAFFLSKSYSYIIEDFLMHSTNIYKNIHHFFMTKVPWISDALASSQSNALNQGLDGLQLPREMKTIFFNSANLHNDVLNVSTFIDNISSFLVKSLSFLITFLLIYFVLLLICAVIDAILKLPLLNIPNKIGGGLIGLIKSCIILYIVFALAAPVIAFIPNNSFVQTVNESEFSEIFYKNNIILNYLSYKGFYDNNKEIK